MGVHVRRGACAVAAVAVVVASAACERRPAPGEPCRELGRASCTGAAQVLVCRGYAWHVDPCRGADGCRDGRCDATVAEDGDTCGERGETACSRDRTTMLRCDGVAFAPVAACHGPDACAPSASGARCDARLARPGDACAGVRDGMRRTTSRPPAGGARDGLPPRDALVACTAEGDAELVCSGGTFAIWKRCRGPGGCAFLDGDVVCDDAVAEAGDTCHSFGDVCATDGKAELRCFGVVNGVYVRVATCPGPKGCAARPYEEHLDCDPGPRPLHRRVATHGGGVVVDSCAFQ